MDLYVSAVSFYFPVGRIAADRHFVSGWKGQIRTVTGAASKLTVAALTVILKDRLMFRRIADRAASASALVCLTHERFSLEANFGLAKTSIPSPVSSKDLRLERTIGHPC